MPIRRATLDDTRAISLLHRRDIDRWQRMDADGRVHDVAYEDLTIYNRWLHGGAWMSIETAALWLSHLLGGAGVPWVLADMAGTITAYAEAYIGQETAPFGKHLHIGKLIASDEAARDTLVQHLLNEATDSGKITVSCIAYDTQTRNFYQRYGLSSVAQVQPVNISATGGNVGFYRATEKTRVPVDRIAGWQMPIGRMENAVYHWQHLWPDLWQAVPEITAHTTHRQVFNVGGQEAYVCLQRQLYDQRSADVYCWTPKALTSQLLGAIRDWAYRQGYRTLRMAVDDKIAKMLGSDVETSPYQQAILARDIKG